MRTKQAVDVRNPFSFYKTQRGAQTLSFVYAFKIILKASELLMKKRKEKKKVIRVYYLFIYLFKINVIMVLNSENETEIKMFYVSRSCVRRGNYGGYIPP